MCSKIVMYKRNRKRKDLVDKENVGKFTIAKPLCCLFFSCITALKDKKKKSKDKKFNKDDNETDSEAGDENHSDEVFCPGIAFWIVFDWPESGLAAFEEYISKEILSAVLDIHSCKAIRSRGKNKNNFI